MATLSKVEIMKLIEVWGEESIQSQLEGCSRNKHIYEIFKKLEEAGYERTGIQCRDKVKILRQEYKKIKDKMTKIGEDGKKRLIDSWDYSEPLDAIL
uniref:Myb/SANT-like DNA-binding domain-containing protein n=1 Tax=Amphimedon queenslandica TaxID=400682 RepID=A0A1X7VXE1_AMPQE